MTVRVPSDSSLPSSFSAVVPGFISLMPYEWTLQPLAFILGAVS